MHQRSAKSFPISRFLTGYCGMPIYRTFEAVSVNAKECNQQIGPAATLWKKCSKTGQKFIAKISMFHLDFCLVQTMGEEKTAADVDYVRRIIRSFEPFVTQINPFFPLFTRFIHNSTFGFLVVFHFYSSIHQTGFPLATTSMT